MVATPCGNKTRNCTKTYLVIQTEFKAGSLKTLHLLLSKKIK